jgi:hypothetical protein
MANSVYTIHKGINRSIEFKGLTAQYIWWLAAGLVALLILYAILYTAGANNFISAGLVLSGGIFHFKRVYRMSKKYGEHGLMKKMARRGIPDVIKSYSRKCFTSWQKS